LLIALYCLFNPSIISVWLSLSFLGLTVDFYEYQLHVFYWWPLWQHSNCDSRKKERNLCTSQHIKIWMLILHFHVPYNWSALLNPGVKWCFLGQNVASRSFLVAKMSHELGEKSKKIQLETSFFWQFSRGFFLFPGLAAAHCPVLMTLLLPHRQRVASLPSDREKGKLNTRQLSKGKMRSRSFHSVKNVFTKWKLLDLRWAPQQQQKKEERRGRVGEWEREWECDRSQR